MHDRESAMSSQPEGTPLAPRQIEGTILASTGWLRGFIRFSERILTIEGESVPAPVDHLPVILPGFIDLHVHGGGGADMMSGQAAVVTATRMHARHGTTSLLATTVTAERAELERVFTEVGASFHQRARGGARVLGLHLEGPFINKDKLGAQPATSRLGTLEEIQALHKRAPIRIVTLAPELEGHLELIKALRSMGIVPQIGHSLGSYETGVAALAAGARGYTHLFNAMTGLHHRAPGMVGAALAHAEYAEIIPDLQHVHPGAILAALRAIPKLYCVTDATAGAGMPDGTYSLGSQIVTKCGEGIRLADGTIAGSTLTMDEALRNLVAIGVALDDASRRLSSYPAHYLDLADRGRIAIDCWADLVVMTSSLQLESVFVEGEHIELADV
jgi:N-acetylglucosamine-6-phosphate deacetylase